MLIIIWGLFSPCPFFWYLSRSTLLGFRRMQHRLRTLHWIRLIEDRNRQGGEKGVGWRRRRRGEREAATVDVASCLGEADNRTHQLLMSRWPSVRDNEIRMAALQTPLLALFITLCGIHLYVYHSRSRIIAGHYQSNDTDFISQCRVLGWPCRPAFITTSASSIESLLVSITVRPQYMHLLPEIRL